MIMHQPENVFSKHKEFQALVIITCILSILGSLLIILTYIFFRDLRTKVRLILLHLSLMDLGIGLSNLVGTAVDFSAKFSNTSIEHHENPGMLKFCKTQAFFAVYSTYGSVFWTNCLAVYLYSTIAYNQTNYSVYVLRFCCGFCYIMPLILTLWLLLTDRFGTSPTGSEGWCAFGATGKEDYFITGFGYDMWMYLTFILVPVLYIGTRAHINHEFERSKDYVIASTFWTAVHRIDYKFLLIPVTFIFLRIWTCIMGIISDYSNMLQDTMNKNDNNHYWIYALYYLSAIGDSGQGAANGIIYVLLTKKVRDKLFPYEIFKRRRAAAISKKDSSVNTKISKLNKTYYRSFDTPPPSSL